MRQECIPVGCVLLAAVPGYLGVAASVHAGIHPPPGVGLEIPMGVGLEAFLYM